MLLNVRTYMAPKAKVKMLPDFKQERNMSKFPLKNSNSYWL